jgi:hypothetical protein
LLYADDRAIAGWWQGLVRRKWGICGKCARFSSRYARAFCAVRTTKSWIETEFD